MSQLDWSEFSSLPGSKYQNFENLCRAIVRLHFGKYGNFSARKNQPGVEFHLQLLSESPILGGPPRWYGWQSKWHATTASGDLTAAARRDILESIQKTKTHVPGITDWVLWTPYTLSKGDQDWFNAIDADFQLHQWADQEIDTYLSGPATILRSTYFGDLIITPEELNVRHGEAVQPIHERWLEPVHQSIEAEREIRRMLGEPDSWSEMIEAGERLKVAAEAISKSMQSIPPAIADFVLELSNTCSAFSETLLNFHEVLASGDLDVIQQKLNEKIGSVNAKAASAPRKLRRLNISTAIDATNALSDLRIAQSLLSEVEDLLKVGLVAILADAGGGKTQMAAQITAARNGRPAGVLLHGRNLHRGQSLDDLVRHYSINAKPLAGMESLLAALDAAGKRSRCRLPIFIDGLNEAENPKDWKAPLAVLSETVKRYPYVLVVCTLRTGEHSREDYRYQQRFQSDARETFAVMALPDSIQRVTVEGFGSDTAEAVEKYFRYFKINPGDSEVPLELLQHPLTLRIFCQVTNQKREKEINIGVFPVSLSPLLDGYVRNACERISQLPNLSYSYGVCDVEAAVYRLGIMLWEGGRREINEINFRAAVNDSPRQWESSVVNLLAQEGIIFRNPGDEPGAYVITPAYDALGGHIIASALLLKNKNDTNFNWLEQPDVKRHFERDTSHELAFDVFKSLVTLTPQRIMGAQLWKRAPERFKRAALLFAMELDAEYLDEETVNSIFEILCKEGKSRQELFPRSLKVRNSINHPLNADFLDRALRAMSVSDRDLSWSEWNRENRRERISEVIEWEKKWRAAGSDRSETDRLRAKWLMWLLTSPDHELRDIATRALYWFGRGSSTVLFEETLSSLAINDPYVPERMLAASYGVAMALHIESDGENFRAVVLPSFARRLYELLFAKEAPHSTTHSLIREYSERICELAVLRNPEALTESELADCTPPFSRGGCRDWEESSSAKGEFLGAESPFRMDFENYTIGRLVPGRSNYDYSHKEYQKVRAQILWRVEQLGWSNDLFKEVDKRIASDSHSPRMGSEARKVDRYGKKYSLIAFLEMHGLLMDQGKLEKDWGERTSNVDIDPSFPERIAKAKPFLENILGDPGMKMEEWIANGPPPNFQPYLRLNDIDGIKGPWVLLDGHIDQEDKDLSRKSFFFIRSFLVPLEDADAFQHSLTSAEPIGGDLPQKPEVHYTFAGEIPWCRVYENNGRREFSIVISSRKVKVKKPVSEYYLDDKDISLTHFDMLRLKHIGTLNGKGIEDLGLREEDLENFKVREKLIEDEELQIGRVTYSVLTPVCSFNWESHHSVTNDAGGATLLAKEIALDLGLIGKPQSFDLYTEDGEKATLNVSDHSGDWNNGQNLFFVRESLLGEYLERNSLALVWVIWGEREYSSDKMQAMLHGPGRPAQPYKQFSFVRRYERP